MSGEERNFFADRLNEDVIGSVMLWGYEQYSYNQSSKPNCFHFFALFSSYLTADNMNWIPVSSVLYVSIIPWLWQSDTGMRVMIIVSLCFKNMANMLWLSRRIPINRADVYVDCLLLLSLKCLAALRRHCETL